MTPASCTPEGAPHHCPVCGKLTTALPDEDVGDAPCSACGALLWFVRWEKSIWSIPWDEMDSELRKRVTEALNNPDADSLDKAEVLLDLENLAGNGE